MRQRILLRLQIPLAVFLIIIIHGCTHTMKVSKVPLLQVSSPLKDLPSKTFFVNDFTDGRVDAIIFTDTGHKFFSDPNLLKIMRNVLMDELTRQGHTCVNQVSKDVPDYIIEGVVYKYSYYMVAGKFTSPRRVAEVFLKLTVIPHNRPGRLTKNYEGSFFIVGFSNTAIIDMLNQALLDAIKQFLLDKEVIELLRST